MDRTGRKDSATIKPIVRKRKWLVSLSIAAGFLLILGMASWFWMYREVIILYETGYGETKEIVLSDNSHVQLNANSKMYWILTYLRKKKMQRIPILTGKR